MFQRCSSSKDLDGLILGYFFVTDIIGHHADGPIETAPSTSSILTLHIGDTNSFADGPDVPRASLLGPQLRPRFWRSGPNTQFVMVMITPAGIARFFPNETQFLLNGLIDLGAAVGDRFANQLLDFASADLHPWQVAYELDGWFRSRLDGTDKPDVERFFTAYASFMREGNITAAAQRLGISIRQLQRLSLRFTGMNPKEIYDIERLRGSIAAVQNGVGDPIMGYADQSHQVRSWKRRLGVTPGGYARQGRSAIRRSIADPTGWSHYL